MLYLVFTEDMEHIYYATLCKDLANKCVEGKEGMVIVKTVLNLERLLPIR